MIRLLSFTACGHNLSNAAAIDKSLVPHRRWFLQLSYEPSLCCRIHFFPPFLSTVSREAMSNHHLFPPGSFPLTTSAKCLFSGECLVRELNITVSTDSAGYCNEINSDVCLSTVLWLRGTKAVVDVIILSIADYRRRGGRRESGWRLYKWHRLNNLLGRGGFYNSADNRDRLQPVMETPPINEKEQRKVRWKQISI